MPKLEPLLRSTRYTNLEIVLSPRMTTMGKKSLEIAGPTVDKNIGMLHRAYSFEMQTSLFFQYVANNIEGIGVLFQSFFADRAKEEQGHAVEINNRLMELGTNPTDDPAAWATESGVGKTESSKYLSLRSALERSLELERFGIGLYNDLANATKDKDHGTYDLALKLLNDELKDEQTIEDILARLEISDVKKSSNS
jgi:bacterioferritin